MFASVKDFTSHLKSKRNKYIKMPAALNTVKSLVQDLKSAWKAQNLKKCGQLVDQLKVSLFFLQI